MERRTCHKLGRRLPKGPQRMQRQGRKYLRNEHSGSLRTTSLCPILGFERNRRCHCHGWCFDQGRGMFQFFYFVSNLFYPYHGSVILKMIIFLLLRLYQIFPSDCSPFWHRTPIHFKFLDYALRIHFYCRIFGFDERSITNTVPCRLWSLELYERRPGQGS
jgi:hypothetical protein